jgi:hypothetical protein
MILDEVALKDVLCAEKFFQPPKIDQVFLVSSSPASQSLHQERREARAAEIAEAIAKTQGVAAVLKYGKSNNDFPLAKTAREQAAYVDDSAERANVGQKKIALYERARTKRLAKKAGRLKKNQPLPALAGVEAKADEDSGSSSNTSDNDLQMDQDGHEIYEVKQILGAKGTGPDRK